MLIEKFEGEGEGEGWPHTITLTLFGKKGEKSCFSLCLGRLQKRFQPDRIRGKGS